MSDTFSAEVAVIGGGPAGLVAAIALATAGVDTLLIAPPAEPDHRTTALLAGSVTALETLGVWPACVPHAAPLRKIRLIDATAAAHSRAGSFVYLRRDRSRRLRPQHREPASDRRARGARRRAEAAAHCRRGALDRERCCRRDDQARQWRSTGEARHRRRRPALAVPRRGRHRHHTTHLSADRADAQSGARAAA